MKMTLTRTLTLVLLIGLALAACTRSVNPTSLPQTTPSTGGGEAGGNETSGAPDAEVATMNAVSTDVARKTTATAVAGSLSGADTTPVAPEVTNTPEPTIAAAVETPTEAPTTDAAIATPMPTTAATTGGTTGTIGSSGAACPNPYTVKEGDWLYKIARDCKVEPSALIAANPGVNPNRISAGQQLNMPGSGATAVPPATSQATSCTGSYTVKSGDNLFRIAYNCGLTTEQLAAANAIRFPYTIYPGQVIKFP